jgi:hypothetical protein
MGRAMLIVALGFFFVAARNGGSSAVKITDTDTKRDMIVLHLL